MDNFSDFCLRSVVERVEILSDGTLQKEGSLGNERDVLSEGVEAKVFTVVIVNEHGAIAQICKSEEGLEDGALTGSSAANDSDSHSSLSLEVQLFQDRLKTWPVGHGDVLELHRSFMGPVLSQFVVLFFLEGTFTRQLGVSVDLLR